MITQLRPREGMKLTKGEVAFKKLSRDSKPRLLPPRPEFLPPSTESWLLTEWAADQWWPGRPRSLTDCGSHIGEANNPSLEHLPAFLTAIPPKNH